MTRSGQCPNCHRIHALGQASFTAALPSPENPAFDGTSSAISESVQCDCGVHLVREDFGDADTIALACAQCEREYVVDQMAAGESLSCCCGAEMAVPTVRLVRQPEAAEPSPKLHTSSFNRQPKAHASSSNPQPTRYTFNLPCKLNATISEKSATLNSFNRQPKAHASSSHPQPTRYAFNLPCKLNATISEKSATLNSFNRQPKAHAPSTDPQPTRYTFNLPCKFNATISEKSATLNSFHRQPKAHAPSTNPQPTRYAFNLPRKLNATISEKSATLSSFNRQPKAHASSSHPQPTRYTFNLPRKLNATISEKSATLSSFNRQPKAHAFLSECNRTISRNTTGEEDHRPTNTSSPTSGNAEVTPVEQSDCPVEPPTKPLPAALPIAPLPELYSITVPPKNPAPEPVSPAEHDSPREPADETTTKFAVTCAGCKTEYFLDRSEINHTAECECGFVFIIRENIDAIDNALALDPITELPVMPDRTGTDRSRKPKPAPIRPIESVSTQSPKHSTSPSRRRRLTRLEIAVVAALLLGLGTIYAATKIPSDDAIAVADVSTPNNTSNEPPRPRTIMRSKAMKPIEELIQEFESLSSLRRAELHRFAEAVIDLDEHRNALQLNDLIWLATQWEILGDRAATPDLASKCFRQASAAYALAESNLGNKSEQRIVASRRGRELLEKSESMLQIAKKSGATVSR